MAEITGAYPGGPAHHQEKAGAAAPPTEKLADGESIEALREGQISKLRKERRHRRVMIGLVASLIAAVGAGAYYGIRSNRVTEALAREEMIQQGEVELNKQTDRILNELWRMEDVERGANR